MVAMYSIVYTKKAAEDITKLQVTKLDGKAKALIDIIREDPYQTPPSYKMLRALLHGAYSRRITIQHRLIYQVIEKEKVVKIIGLWTHYDF